MCNTLMIDCNNNYVILQFLCEEYKHFCHNSDVINTIKMLITGLLTNLSLNFSQVVLYTNIKAIYIHLCHDLTDMHTNKMLIQTYHRKV